MGIFAQRHSHERHQFVVLLLIAKGLGKNDYVARDALPFKVFEGNRIADASVEQFSALYMNHL